MKKEKVYLEDRQGHIEIGTISYEYPGSKYTSMTYSEVTKGISRKDRHFLAGANAASRSNVFASIRAVNAKLQDIGSEWKIVGLATS